jgi:hypothetical protein
MGPSDRTIPHSQTGHTMKQPSRQNHRNNRNKGGRRSSGGGNNNAGGGHSANRVYDSSGPEGKVRGTAQQIIDKYTSLARDAQTSGEGVLAENFYQHAEHYQRILTTIQAAEAEERERRQAAQQAEQERRAEQQARQQQNRNDQGGHDAPQSDAPQQDQPTSGETRRAAEPAQLSMQSQTRPSSETNGQDNRSVADVQPSAGSDGPALVETPEAKIAEQREVSPRPARRARPKPKVDEADMADADPVEAPAPAVASDVPDMAAADAPAKPKRGRPRKTPPPPAEEADVTS